MNPFGLFLVLAIVGGLLLVAGQVITDCRETELVQVLGTVLDKTIVVREEALTSQVVCPACPGGTRRTVTEIVKRELYLVVVQANANGKPATYRIEISEKLYRELSTGDQVELRFLRGKKVGLQCSPIEILRQPAS